MVKRSSSKMKKTYMMPALQISEAQIQNMMAVSLHDDSADPSKPVLTKENSAWDVWGDEE